MKVCSVSAAVSCVNSYYFTYWGDHLRKLLNSRTITDTIIEGLLPEATPNQIQSYAGVGPWTCSGWREECRKILDMKSFILLERQLEDLYLRFAECMLPPLPYWQAGTTKFIYLQEDHHHHNNTVQYGLTALEILDMLSNQKSNIIYANDISHLILIMRTPQALFSSNDVSDDNQKNTVNEESILKGSHEIVHGEYTSEDARKRNQIKKHSISNIFTELIDGLFDWVEDGDGPAKIRKVTLVSVGWDNGYNFIVSRNASCSLTHESLLESNGALPNLMAKEAIQMSDADKIMSDIMSSLPEGVQIHPSLPAVHTPRRCLSIADPLIDTIKFVPIPLDPPIPLNVLPSKSTNEEAVCVIEGPKILRLTSTEVHFGITCSGLGEVKCYIYNLPQHSHAGNISYLLDPDDPKLTLAGLSRKWARNKVSSSEIIFQFNNLRPYSTYGAVLEIGDESRENSHMCHFRTLCVDTSTTSTVTVAAVTDNDYSMPSLVIAKAMHMLQEPRMTSAPIYLQHLPTYLQYLKQPLYDADSVVGSYEPFPLLPPRSMLPLSEFCDFSKLSKCAHVIHTSYYNDELRLRRGVHLSFNGKFCRIASKVSSADSLEDICKVIDLVEHTSNFDSLMIFVSRPLIPHLKKDNNGKWIAGRKVEIRKRLVIKLVERLFDWKKQQSGRDCIIVCLSEIINMRCVVFSDRSDPTNLLTIRHLLLPHLFNSNSPTVLIPSTQEVIELGSRVQYEVFDPTQERLAIIPILPQISVYGEQYKPNVSEPVLYRIDTITSHRPRSGYVSHNVVVKMIVNDIDNIELVIGPVIGLLTTQTVRILFELSKDVIQVQCLLKTINQPVEEEIDQVKKRVKAYKSFVYLFESLKRGMEYAIFLPNVFGEKCLGVIRTPALCPPFLRFAFTGNNAYEEQPVLDKLITHTFQQQTVDLHQISRDAGYQNDDDFELSLLPSETRFHEDTWGLIANHMRRPLHEISSLIHLGPHTVVTARINDMLTHLIKQTLLFELPLKDNSLLNNLYFNQLEEIIKDLFRIIWNIPNVRDSLLLTSNLFLYHSHYNMPLDSTKFAKLNNAVDESTGEEEKNEKSEKDPILRYINMIRKLFDTQYQSYIGSLTDYNQEVGHHAMVWRLDTTVIVIFDIVSGRKKMKKKKNAKRLDVLSDNSGRKRKSKADRITSFSLGFLDEIQYNLLKNLLRDTNIVQLVLCCQEPFVSLRDIPNEFKISSAKVPRGSIVPWRPTRPDLTYFFTMLFRWIESKRDNVARSVALVCASDVPYTTTIQDGWSGAMIQQVCLGRLSRDSPPPPASSRMSSPITVPEYLQNEGSISMSPTGRHSSYLFSDLDGDMYRNNRDSTEQGTSRDKVITPQPSLSRESSMIIRRKFSRENSHIAAKLMRESSSIMSRVNSIRESYHEDSIGESRSYSQGDDMLEAIEDIEYVMSGELGELKYSHRVMGLHDVHIDSSNVRSGGGTMLKSDIAVSAAMNFCPDGIGFGLLHIWLDTWKATCAWSFCMPNEVSVIPFRQSLESHEELISSYSIMLFGPVVGAPISVEKHGKKFVEIPILVEIDTEAVLLIAATDMFGGGVIGTTVIASAHRPTAFTIGPLELEKRYSVVMLSGVGNKTDFNLIIETFYHHQENNIAILNDRYIETNPHCSEFIQNLVHRCSIPFHGISAILHINMDFRFDEILNKFKNSNKNVCDVLNDSYQKKRVPVFMKLRLHWLMERLRDEFRFYFSRPSLRELFKRSYHLFMLVLVRYQYNSPTSSNHINRSVSSISESELASVTSEAVGSSDYADILLNLMLCRVKQEYINQLHHIHLNDPIYYALKRKFNEETSVKSIGIIDAKRKSSVIRKSTKFLSELPKVSAKLTPNVESKPTFNVEKVPVDPKISPLDAVLGQWFAGLEPADIEWLPYKSPNGYVIIEQFCAPVAANTEELCREAERDAIDRGVRIVVLEGAGPSGGADELLDTEQPLGQKFQRSIMKWVKKKNDRDLFLVSPSMKDGTIVKTISRLNDGSSTGIQFIDSCYKSNTQLNAGKVLEDEKMLKKKHLITGKEPVTVMNKDGIVILECRSLVVKIKDTYEDFYSSVTSRILNSLPSNETEATFNYSELDSERPSPVDFLHLPEWLLRFAPASRGVLIRDEVVLWSRQHPLTRKIIDRIDSDDFFGEILVLYEESKLCELSRPLDLREVDVTAPGVSRLNLKELCQRIWESCLTAQYRSRMLNISDDFVISFILSHLRPPKTVFSSGIDFAGLMQQVLILSSELFLASEMIHEPTWKKYMASMPEFPVIKRLENESDLEEDPQDVQEDEGDLEAQGKGKNANKRDSLRSSIRVGIKENKKGGDQEKKEKEKKIELTPIQRFYESRIEITKLAKQRTMQRRHYGEKIQYDNNVHFPE